MKLQSTYMNFRFLGTPEGENAYCGLARRLMLFERFYRH